MKTTQKTDRQVMRELGLTIGALAADVHEFGQYLKNNYDPKDLTEYGEDEPSGDIRLQIHGGGWQTHHGDSQYDQDHRGAWGSSCVPVPCAWKAARDIARDLIDQVLDQLAEQSTEEEEDPTADYSVIVGNIGTVRSDVTEEEARKVFADYVKQSKSGRGRAGSEPVTLMKGEEIVEEHTPDLRCDQCEALMVNGIYCHEIGCPNTPKVKIEGEWITPDVEEEEEDTELFDVQ